MRKVVSAIWWILRLGGLAGDIRDVYQAILYIASYGFALTVTSTLGAILDFISQISLFFRIPLFIGVFLLVLALIALVVDYGLRHILAQQQQHKPPDSIPSEVAHEWYSDPKTPVVGRSYLNDKVELDGRSFSQCTFTNVTFVYRGRKDFDFHPDNTIQGSFTVTATTPQLQGLIRILNQLGYIKPEKNLVYDPYLYESNND